MSKTMQRYLSVATLALALAGAPAGTAQAAFNDEYVYAATKAVNHMNAHAVAKAPLYPLTVVLDTALLPFTVIAGFVTG